MLLPFIDQSAIYNQVVPYMNGTASNYYLCSSPTTWPGAKTQISVLKCPTDPNAGKKTGLNVSGSSVERVFSNYTACQESTGTSVPSGTSTDDTATISGDKFEVEIPPGRYLVWIQKYEYVSGGDAKPLLPEKYNRKTTLSAEISEQGPNRLSFQLGSK